MPYNSSRVKDYCIALEALSRVNHPATGNAFKAIEDLLDKAISQGRKELDSERVKPTDTDEDIPF